ncbi:MAG: hypothetical protein M0Z53_00635 [Thermaerobacter sp.]|nr:hypothetical protein [Thermaerobacter sp.]
MGGVFSVSLGFGSWVVLPIAIGLAALVHPGARTKWLKAPLFVAAGLTGGYVMVAWLIHVVLPPLARSGIWLFHSHAAALDIGWPSSAIIAFGTLAGVLSFPVGLLTNAALVFARLTRTLDLDLWNFWHIAFVGVFATVATGDIVKGLIAEAGAMAVVLMLADISQPTVKKYFGYENLSFPTLVSLPYFVLAVGLKHLFRKTGFLSSQPLGLEKLIRERGQAFSPGNFVVIGFAVTVAIGLLAHLGVKSSLFIGVVGATTILILPRIVSLVVEGIQPVAEAMAQAAQAQVAQRHLHIGMDTALLVGDPVNMLASTVLVPVTLALALVLPGNHTVPLLDLPTIPFIIALMVPVFEGNLCFTIIGGIAAMVPTLYISTCMAPLFGSATRLAGWHVAYGGAMVTSLVDAGNPIVWAFSGMAQLGMVQFVGAIAAVLVLLSLIRGKVVAGVR